MKRILPWLLVLSTCFGYQTEPTGLPLYYWNESLKQTEPYVNFGDYLSLKLVERIVNQPVYAFPKNPPRKVKKLLAVGSILVFAYDNDVIWGSGINGKTLTKQHYRFNHLDVRAVRGPLTRQFLMENFNIPCPEVYGDPALLFPYFFPEFQRKENPSREYIIIPNCFERSLFPKENPNVVHPTEPWNEVIEKILDSKFVISSSLHGIIIAEAYGIPARLLRPPNTPNHLFKYQDYYSGTKRPNFRYAISVEEALLMGGEPPFECDLQKLYEAFPFDYWEKNSIDNNTSLIVKRD
ncbi:MAG: polysaccharide pyruvyl transferase family protein [Verrucomicrobiota bacterium]|nr:polysaccharide pyruvyl transferase family protein [Verrucomicrobiota bacterium]